MATVEAGLALLQLTVPEFRRLLRHLDWRPMPDMAAALAQSRRDDATSSAHDVVAGSAVPA